MPRLTIDELLSKNQEDITREQENLRTIKNRIKKLDGKRKELLARQEKQNEQSMLEQLKTIQIKSPADLQALLDLYKQDNNSDVSADEEIGTGSAL